MVFVVEDSGPEATEKQLDFWSRVIGEWGPGVKRMVGRSGHFLVTYIFLVGSGLVAL